MRKPYQLWLDENVKRPRRFLKPQSLGENSQPFGVGIETISCFQISLLLKGVLSLIKTDVAIISLFLRQKISPISQASQTYQRDDFVSNWKWNTWKKITDHSINGTKSASCDLNLPFRSINSAVRASKEDKWQRFHHQFQISVYHSRNQDLFHIPTTILAENQRIKIKSRF